MSREGEARFAYGELIGARFGRLRLAARNIARGRAETSPSKMIDSEVPPGKMSEVVSVVSVTGPAPGNTRRDEGIQVRA